jgi:uroporphyrinogen-III synthase
MVSPPHDSPQFDSEHLWPLLKQHDWSAKRVLIISGGHDGQAQGRPWLTAQLQAAGAMVSSVLAYERQTAHWTQKELGLAQTAYSDPASYLWLFSSSEAVHHLVDRMGPPPANALSMVTHPRVAETALELGFNAPQITPPRLEDLAQAVAQLPRL